MSMCFESFVYIAIEAHVRVSFGRRKLNATRAERFQFRTNLTDTVTPKLQNTSLLKT